MHDPIPLSDLHALTGSPPQFKWQRKRWRRPPSEAVRLDVVRRILDGGTNVAIAKALGLTKGQVSGIRWRMTDRDAA